MKIKNLLKFLMTFTAILTVSMSMAQTQDEHEPYVHMEIVDPAATDSVTVGSRMVYYVEPDPALNSFSSATQYDTTWTRTQAETEGITSTWNYNWKNGNNIGDIHPPYPDGTSGSNWNAPYRAITFNSAGTDVLQVQEISNFASNCSGTTVEKPIEAVPAPQFSVGNPDVVERCGVVTAEPIQISGSTVPVKGGQVYFKMDIDVAEDTDQNGTIASSEIQRTQADTIVKVNCPTDGSAITTTILEYDMRPRNGNITRYRFDFGSTVDNTQANGINDYVSRKSDYFSKEFHTSSPDDGDFTYYASSDADDSERIIVFEVYPQPETGDIYHIANNQYQQ